LLEDIARAIVFTIDHLLIKLWSNCDQIVIFGETIEECMIKIYPMTNKMLIEMHKFIKNVRHFWHLESHRSLSSRPEDLRTWEPEDLRTGGPEDNHLDVYLRSQGWKDHHSKSLLNSLCHIHYVTFNSNDLRYLSCCSDFSSSWLINSGPRW
jgi:hypothetical protein